MLRQRARATDRIRLAALLGCGLFAPFGCQDVVIDWSFLFGKRTKTTVESHDLPHTLEESAAYRDTIAEYAYFDGLRRLRVRGYGVVAGLGRKGSTECPNSVRSQLIQEMYKTRKFAERRGQYVTPEQLIDDKDTAVVTVEGEIPAAVAAGKPFDVVVRALPGTQTTSLEGGWLYPCNLTLFQQRGAAGWIPGKTVATAAGPIFLNPFGRGENAATPTHRREGIVIGGGTAEEDRRIRLVLTVPSYQRAITIAERINARFGNARNLVADAVSPAEVKLIVPPRHRHDPKHFISVVQHLYLPASRPGFISERIRELAREFGRPDAPHVEIALAWEGLGRNVLPEAQKFYADPRPAGSFFSAVAGLRLGDDDAVDVLEKHLAKTAGPYRAAAIRVLGSALHSRHAARPLRRVLNDADPLIRIAAYEALRRRDDPTIATISVGGSFDIDVVNTDAENLIYVKRTEHARIVLFGADIRARPPLFFSLPDESLIIDADAGAERARIIRRSGVRGLTSPTFDVDLDLKNLIAFIGGEPPESRDQPVGGLGVDYGSVVLALSELCKAHAINARFMLESPSTALTRPLVPSRPESEL